MLILEALDTDKKTHPGFIIEWRELVACAIHLILNFTCKNNLVWTKDCNFLDTLFYFIWEGWLNIPIIMWDKLTLTYLDIFSPMNG
jgi:hypothetical protein